MQKGCETVYPAVVVRTTAANFSIEADVESSVFCNRKLIFTSTNLLQAMLSCYCTYYALDLHYPAALKSFFLFLDGFVCNTAAKIKIPTSCQKVVNKLMA